MIGPGQNIQIQTHSHTDISASVTALVSLLTDRLVRPDLSMTGEITLRGLVLPVGGVRDKVSIRNRKKDKKLPLGANQLTKKVNRTT